LILINTHWQNKLFRMEDSYPIPEQVLDMQMGPVYYKVFQFASNKKPYNLESNTIRFTKSIFLDLKNIKELLLENLETNLRNNYEQIITRAFSHFRLDKDALKDFPNIFDVMKLCLSSPTFFDVNYKDLLRRYICHVADMETNPFLTEEYFIPDGTLTREEFDLLGDIEYSTR